jgi:hypothetical protein
MAFVGCPGQLLVTVRRQNGLCLINLRAGGLGSVQRVP